MSTFYLDLVNGNDANNGSDWAHAWQTITSGATAARIAPGDEIRIAKTADPVSLGVDATWTNNSNVVELASAITAPIANCVGANSTDYDGWTASANVTRATSTTYRKYYDESKTYGTGFTVASAFTTGGIAYKDSVTSDLSFYSQFSFWIYSTVALAANTLRLRLSNGADTDKSYTIPYVIAASTWYPINSGDVGTLPGESGQPTVCLDALLDPGTPTIYLSNIFAHNGFSLLSLISKASVGTPANPNIINETFWVIKSIQGTSIYLGAPYENSTIVNSVYDGNVGTVATYKRECWQSIVPSTATADTNWGKMQKSGTYGAPITFSGGWDQVSGLQDGETWCDGSTSIGGGIDTNGKECINVTRMKMVRYYRPWKYSSTGSDFNTTDCGTIAGFSNGCLIPHVDNGAVSTTGGETHTNFTAIQNTNGTASLTINNGVCRLINPQFTANAPIWLGGSVSIYKGYIGNIRYNGSAAPTLYNGSGNGHIMSVDTQWPDASYAGSGLNNNNGRGIFFTSVNHNNVSGSSVSFANYAHGIIGTYKIERDTSIYDTGNSSLRLTPNHSTVKADSGPPGYGFQCKATSGNTSTISMKLRKSVAGDGAAYNGNQPRLILRANYVQGVIEDTVLDTMSVSNGEWETLTGTTPTAIQDGIWEVCGDCDGTAGWINCDTVGVE